MGCVTHSFGGRDDLTPSMPCQEKEAREGDYIGEGSKFDKEVKSHDDATQIDVWSQLRLGIQTNGELSLVFCA